MNDRRQDTNAMIDSQNSQRREEVLIPDERASLTPAQMVERKLVSTLRRCPLLVSQLQTSVRYRFS